MHVRKRHTNIYLSLVYLSICLSMLIRLISSLPSSLVYLPTYLPSIYLFLIYVCVSPPYTYIHIEIVRLHFQGSLILSRSDEEWSRGAFEVVKKKTTMKEEKRFLFPLSDVLNENFDRYTQDIRRIFLYHEKMKKMKFVLHHHTLLLLLLSFSPRHALRYIHANTYPYYIHRTHL